MNERHIQILGILLVLTYGIFIVFLYAAEPRSLDEISSKARTTVENAVSKGQVVIGTYEIDQAQFNEGLTAFNQNRFIAARDSFDIADPEKRDARTQFYIAYSYYRQGWGRFSNDDELFKKGLGVLERVDMLDRNFRSTDANLILRSPSELRAELEEGLKITMDDFNPLKLARERK
ncbi:MAG: hypothetical protein ACT4O9_16365 [Blastocatellia bacterium]